MHRLLAGALAGAAGTLAMDRLWYRRYRSGGGDQPFGEWEVSSGTEGFDDAGAPAEAGRRAADAAGVDIPPSAAGTTADVVHWGTGIGYGVAHALLHDDRGLLAGGVLTGLTAVASSYATLGAVGIYQPVWAYDRDTLVQDVTAHLVYGLATSAAHRLLR